MVGTITGSPLCDEAQNAVHDEKSYRGLPTEATAA
jgi:hypothetical protein